jgi:hypothetical protein
MLFIFRRTSGRFFLFASVFFFIFASIQSVVANANANYASSSAVQIVLDYHAWVEFMATTPDAKTVKEKIDQQSRFAIGPMFHGFGGAMAAPFGEPKITVEKITPAHDSAHQFRVKYHYVGKATMEKNGSSLDVLLPINPDELEKKINARCEIHYGAWYDWSPACGGFEENTDYLQIPIPVQKIPNTVSTYPEYSRLLNSKGEILTSFFVGSNASQDPEDDDIFKPEFENVRAWLSSHDYELKTFSHAELAARFQLDPKNQIPIFEEYTKTTAKGKMIVHVFFGTTALGYDSKAFHMALKEALENSSLILYSGHSGLGKNVNLSMIEKARGFQIKMPKDRYQIVFMNGCLTYTYYGQQFIERKKTATDPAGTKNLDEVTVALEGYGQSQITVLFGMVNDWAEGATANLSYQDFADRIPDSMTGVVGDEDNPTALEGVTPVSVTPLH